MSKKKENYENKIKKKIEKKNKELNLKGKNRIKKSLKNKFFDEFYVTENGDFIVGRFFKIDEKRFVEYFFIESYAFKFLEQKEITRPVKKSIEEKENNISFKEIIK